MRDNVIAASKVTEEEPLRELLLPRDSTTRLCFFSLPLELLSFYRNRIFPIVKEIGFVPVTADDVIAPGDNVNAKIDALIDRASTMIVELTSPWTRAEYEMAVARLKGAEANKPHRRSLQLIVIVTHDEQLPPSTRDFTVVRRPDLITGEADEFVEDLTRRLQEIANDIGIGQEIGLAQQDEPRRLYEAKEYRAAVISAMTLLESTLRQRLGKELSTDVRRPATLRQLVEHAAERGMINPFARDLIHPWTRVRNEAVHTSKQISRSEARDIVDGVYHVLQLN